jgi:hypothetical protein
MSERRETLEKARERMIEERNSHAKVGLKMPIAEITAAVTSLNATMQIAKAMAGLRNRFKCNLACRSCMEKIGWVHEQCNPLQASAPVWLLWRGHLPW